MKNLSDFTPGDVDLDLLESVITEAGRPVHINVLARATIQARMKSVPGERNYASGSSYATGETILFNSQIAQVKDVRTGGNPKQGQFQVVSLVLPDGTEQHVAAEVTGAPSEDRRSASRDHVRRIVEKDGTRIRVAIQEALTADDRFVWFQDAQGDYWCLTNLLPEVGGHELTRAWSLLHGLLQDGIIHPRSTEELVEAIWEQENDGSDAYQLKAFALNSALRQFQEARFLVNGWVLEEEWQEIQERPVLVGPSKDNVIEMPEGIVSDDEEKEEEDKIDEEEGQQPEQIEIRKEDLEAWRQNRRLNATITLRASHYYGNWLPLTKDMQRVFPPRASQADAVTFHHQFGGEEETFQAWADWEHGRILGSPQMYEAFYHYGIYPGAKLIVSHRGNSREYDIRTKPATKQEPIRVRRVYLVTDDNGQPILDKDGYPRIESEESDEPRRYEVSDEVFIAAASWEDLPALFAEADRSGQGYFGLMYQVCREWWEAGGRKPLYVTSNDLFQEIHYNRRSVTSDATIPWALWRWQAFESVGEGRYLFRPEKGDRVRAVGPRRRTPKRVVVPDTPRSQRKKSFRDIVQQVGAQAAMAEERSEDQEPVWNMMKKLIGREFQTLAQKQPFLVLYISSQALDILIESTGQNRTINREEVEDAWQHLTSQGELSRIEINAEYSSFNPAYIAALFANLPGVTYQTDPIRLSYGPLETEKERPALDPGTMYLLGLAAARGVFTPDELRISLQKSTLETDAAGLDESAIAKSIDLLEERLSSQFGTVVKFKRAVNVTDIIVAKETKLYEVSSNLIGTSGSLTVPEFVYNLSREEKIEFARGFADAAGYVRRAQYYTDGRIFIFFQIRQSDWFLPTQICRLFQLELGIPVSFIIWGHPNIRDPRARSSEGSWAKEHQLKVFCDAFEEVGFHLSYKQQAFDELVRINKEIGKPIPALCHPKKKTVRNAKPPHPEEASEKLPVQLQRTHCDAWWQVCLNMGCPFKDEYPQQGTLFG